MIIMPVRSLEEAEGGVWCRLGSQPPEDAPKEWIPSECILNRSVVEGGELAVLVLDEASIPERIRRAVGLK
jgi:hypothetical protein